VLPDGKSFQIADGSVFKFDEFGGWYNNPYEWFKE